MLIPQSPFLHTLSADVDGSGSIDKHIICDPASQNHQKVARYGFLVKARFYKREL